MSIEPVGSEKGTLKMRTLPTSGLGPGAMGKVYLDRSVAYSSYVTWSARSLGAGIYQRGNMLGSEDTTLIFIVDFSELGIHPVHDRRVEGIYQRDIGHGNEILSMTMVQSLNWIKRDNIPAMAVVIDFCLFS
jgi:hypothetical protein